MSSLYHSLGTAWCQVRFVICHCYNSPFLYFQVHVLCLSPGMAHIFPLPAERFSGTMKYNHNKWSSMKIFAQKIQFDVSCHVLQYDLQWCHTIPTIQYHNIPYNTIPYNTIPYNTIQYHTIQYNTIQYHTIQYNTIPYNTIQYNKIQYNTIQYNTIPSVPYNTIPYTIHTILTMAVTYNTIPWAYNTIQYPYIYSTNGYARLQNGKFYKANHVLLYHLGTAWCQLSSLRTCLCLSPGMAHIFPLPAERFSGTMKVITNAHPWKSLRKKMFDVLCHVLHDFWPPNGVILAIYSKNTSKNL